MSKENVARVPFGDRGLVQYGQESITDTYGSRIEVSTSSAAGYWALWVRVEGSNMGSAALHLNIEQAAEVRDRLAAWIDDVESVS